VLAFPRDTLRLISTLGHRKSVLATAGQVAWRRSAAPAFRWARRANCRSIPAHPPPRRSCPPKPAGHPALPKPARCPVVNEKRET
jgi:hypothetical protein